MYASCVCVCVLKHIIDISNKGVYNKTNLWERSQYSEALFIYKPDANQKNYITFAAVLNEIK